MNKQDACRALNVVLDFFVTSPHAFSEPWVSMSKLTSVEEELQRWRAFGVVLLGQRSVFSPFIDIRSHSGSLGSESIRKSAATLSRQTDLNYLVCHLFLNFL